MRISDVVSQSNAGLMRYEFREQDTVLYEGETIRVVVPCQPHTRYHLMIVLKRNDEVGAEVDGCYISGWDDLTWQERTEVTDAIAACVKVLRRSYGAVIVNVQQNGNWYYLKNDVGSEPGSKFHVHIYPRFADEPGVHLQGGQYFGDALVFPGPTYPTAEDCWMHYVPPPTDDELKDLTESISNACHFFK